MEHLEGRQSVLAALRARQRRFEVVLVSLGAHLDKVQDVLDAAEAAGVPVKRVDPRQLDAMAHGLTHGGVLAVCSAKPRASLEDLQTALAASPDAPLLLLLEGVEDARNLGFVIRSAEALGAQAVLIKKHLWDLDPVEVARPASGAYERLPLVQVEEVAPLLRLQREGIQIIGCMGGTRRTLYDLDLTRPTMLCIGGEKRGLSGALRAICNRRVCIPTHAAAASSLSLSHASAIVLAEAMRQRRAATPFTDADLPDADEPPAEDA